LDQALVGAVDLPCDTRSRVAHLRLETDKSSASVSDGAAAVILKRLDDALRDGDRIHAVIRDLRSDSDSNSIPAGSPSGSSVGAATGLVDFAIGVKSLTEKTLHEPMRCHWLRNRIEGPRRLSTPGDGIDGKSLVFELTDHERQDTLQTTSAVVWSDES